MSRIGIYPVKILDGVTVEFLETTLKVKGPKGENHVEVPTSIKLTIDNNEIKLEKLDEMPHTRAMFGTVRNLIQNAVTGVTEGFNRKLEIHGVGYRVRLEGQNVSLSLGWNHPVVVEPPTGITFEVPNENALVVSGHSKQQVGEVAAKIRELRKPEPYKGKGIRYDGEYVRRKSAKNIK